MKARMFTTLLLSLLIFSMYAGDLEGLWRSTDQNRNMEIMYTTNGIKARSAGQSGNDWVGFDRFETNRYRDSRGNCLSLYGATLEWCTADRRQVINYLRDGDHGNVYNNNGTGYGNNNGGVSGGDPRTNNRGNDNRDRDHQYGGWNNSRNGRDDWNNRDRASWNNYYQAYEGKWHNHTTGQRITVDLTRKSLRIKFKGESWFEVFERNRGLFADQRGNEFIFNGDVIEYRSNDGDLSMKFYNDDRCVHQGDFRSEYWK